MAKATRKQALGRGLSALLKEPHRDLHPIKIRDTSVGSIVEIDLDLINW